jgi:hypothetical protein
MTWPSNSPDAFTAKCGFIYRAIAIGGSGIGCNQAVVVVVVELYRSDYLLGCLGSPADWRLAEPPIIE